ncbi:hypothetical protein EON64_16145 [archaeon]|nr:MAG: hypothetical protein EON64_16145 [archaeon]
MHQHWAAEAYRESRQPALASSMLHAYLDTLQKTIHHVYHHPADGNGDLDVVQLCDEGVHGAYQLHQGHEDGGNNGNGIEKVLERRVTATLLQTMCSICAQVHGHDRGGYCNASCTSSGNSSCTSPYGDMCRHTLYYQRPKT